MSMWVKLLAVVVAVFVGLAIIGCLVEDDLEPR